MKAGLDSLHELCTTTSRREKASQDRPNLERNTLKQKTLDLRRAVESVRSCVRTLCLARDQKALAVAPVRLDRRAHEFDEIHELHGGTRVLEGRAARKA